MLHDLIQAVLTPALMISACGLLCLAQFARFTALIGRARGFNHERHNLARTLHTIEDQAGDKTLILGRIQALEFQANRVIEHARLIRNALVMLVGCIMMMLITSLLLAASFMYPGLWVVELVTFVLGLLFALVGMGCVLWEMMIALSLVEYETSHVETFGAVDQLQRGSAM